MTELRVRHSTAGDADRFAALVHAADLPLEGLEQAAVRFVADRDGELVGVAALEEHQDEDGRVFLLRSVAVQSDAQGGGIGAALVRAALQHVDGEGAPVALLTETAPDYFPRFGFRQVPRVELPAALDGSAELRGACAVSARAFMRSPQGARH